MIDRSRIQEILDDIGSDYFEINNGFKVKCFICGDSQKSNRIKRLKITPYKDNWVGYCWNGGCECKGMTIYSMYAQVKGISFSQAKKFINDGVYDIEKIKDRLQTKRTEVQTQQNNTDIDIPDECLSITAQPQDRFQERYLTALKDFVTSRQIPNKYKCFVAYSGKYKGRIIVPVFIKNKLMYFQGRSIFDNIDPKYLNPVIDKTGIILNSDSFDRNRNIIVTEGIIDAWMVEGNQGTSCLGAYFSDDLIQKLLRLTDKSVILCFDNPLIDKSGHDEIMKFMKDSVYKNKVKYFIPENNKYKDLNEIKVNTPDINVYDYVVGNSNALYSTATKLKLLYKYNI